MYSNSDDRLNAKEHRMDKIDHAVSYIFTFLTFFSIAGTAYIAILTTVNVFCRFVFSHNITFILETSELCMGLIAFGAFPVVTLYDRHIKVDLIVSRFSPKAQKFMSILNLVFGAGMTFFISYFTYQKGLRVLDRGICTNSTRIPHWPFYMFIAAMLLVAGLCCLYNIVHLFITGKSVDEYTFGAVKAIFAEKKKGGGKSDS